MNPISRCAPLLIVGTLLANAVSLADEGSQAPVAYTLEINGQSYQLKPDEPLKLDGEFSNPTVVLRAARTRSLQAAGVTFEYPAYFTFESDTTDVDVQTWTATGNDVTLMLFSFGEMVEPQKLASSTSTALKAKETRMEDVKLKLGQEDRAGVKATMNLGTKSVVQQVLTLPPTPKGSRLLVVQEVRGTGENETPELGETLRLVASSLKVNPES